jgi:3-oxoacyl-[acyl-carrier protein] reductase
MDYGIADKTALVCGASRGIGEACARLLAGEGVRTIVLARNRKRLDEVVREICDAGHTAMPLAADLSRVHTLDRIAQEAISLFGQVDILINNTGGPPTGGDLEFSIEDWEESFKNTFLSASELTKQLIPAMAERGWGRVINLTSITVRQPLEGLILSNSVRMAVIGWAKTLSRQFAPYGVTINNIATGFTLTDRVREIVRARAEKESRGEDEVMAGMVQDIPMGRMASPEEIAQLALFLAGRGASYMTGTTIPVDGGFHAATL